MAGVAFAGATGSHASGSMSASETSFTWNHTPTAVPRGVVVFVCTGGSTDIAGTVTYGGVAMTDMNMVIDSAGEPGRVDAYFLGTGVPTGQQAVVVNRANDTTIMTAVVITVSAGADTKFPLVYPAYGSISGDGTLAEQALDDSGQSPNGVSLRLGAVYSGLSVPPGVGGSSTSAYANDLGVRGFAACYETTPGNGSRNIGFSSGTSDDRAYMVCMVVQKDPDPAGGARSFAVVI